MKFISFSATVLKTKLKKFVDCSDYIKIKLREKKYRRYTQAVREAEVMLKIPLELSLTNDIGFISIL